MFEPVIVIHGGAWAIPDELAEDSRKGVKMAAKIGFEVLTKGGSAIDAVQAAVVAMENDPVFDCGTGSVLNSLGEVEMDAVIMDGRDLSAGGVAAVQNIFNPVKLARMVMEKTDHTLLVGKGANLFAEEMGVPEVSPEDLVTETAKQDYEKYLKYKMTIKTLFNGGQKNNDWHDTVGAVARDRHGNMAFATSTGGITAKRPGRVGDSPIIGSGGYADNEAGAVSSTGHGEAIAKVCLAKHITDLMKTGVAAKGAAEAGLRYMASRVHGFGGVVGIGPGGDIAHVFTTERMAWASIKGNELHSGLNPNEDIVEDL